MPDVPKTPNIGEVVLVEFAAPRNAFSVKQYGKSECEQVTIPAGQHRMTCIGNPMGGNDSKSWLVLTDRCKEGLLIGLAAFALLREAKIVDPSVETSA